MTLSEILRRVRVGDSFYRESKPDILYERIGTLIERNGLGWATLEGTQHRCGWHITPEQKIDEDILAADWILCKGNLKEFDPLAKPPRYRSSFTEKTRHGWTFYDQTEAPKQ